MLKQLIRASTRRSPLNSSKRFFLVICALIVAFPVFSQEANEKVQMADGLRSNGKIFVVVAVLLTVLSGLILYLVTLDKKISKLEKEQV